MCVKADSNGVRTMGKKSGLGSGGIPNRDFLTDFGT